MNDAEESPEYMREQSITTYNLGCQDTAKKIVKWGDDDCTEHGHFHTAELLTEYGGSKATYPYERHECPECWQQLKEDVGL